MKAIIILVVAGAIMVLVANSYFKEEKPQDNVPDAYWTEGKGNPGIMGSISTRIDLLLGKKTLVEPYDYQEQEGTVKYSRLQMDWSTYRGKPTPLNPEAMVNLTRENYVFDPRKIITDCHSEDQICHRERYLQQTYAIPKFREEQRRKFWGDDKKNDNKKTPWKRF